MLFACGMDEQVDMCINTLDGDKELKKNTWKVWAWMGRHYLVGS
jgi:hypothetical protein